MNRHQKNRLRKKTNITNVINEDIKVFLKREIGVNAYLASIGYLNEEDYNKLLSCEYAREGRSPHEYGIDMAYAWAGEKNGQVMLKRIFDIDSFRSGSDAGFNFSYNKNITTNSDLIGILNGNQVNIEVVEDHWGFWKKSGKMHLRDSKFKNLKKSSRKTFIFAIDYVNKTVALILVDNSLNSTHVPSHFPYGGKPAEEIKLRYEEMFVGMNTNPNDNQLTIFVSDAI